MKGLFAIILLMWAAGVSARVADTDTVMSGSLDEVVVKGEKPQIGGRDGIMVVDLPSIVSDKPVTNVLESLGYLPGVVNNKGLIGLAGASSVTIILNGELTNMPVDNLYQLLYSIPVDRLKNVEVMYAAPARYHVDGAVINIVLKTPSPLDGLQGQARAGYNWKHYSSYGAGLAATYATGRWTFDLNYGLSRAKTWNREETFSNHQLDGKRTMIEDDSRRTGRNLSNTVYASGSYRISDKSKLGMTYNGQFTTGARARAVTTGTPGSFSNDINYNAPIEFHNVALKYVSQIGLTVGGDYTRYSEDRTQHLRMAGEDVDRVVATNRQSINRYHAYADQMHDLAGWQLSYGVEYQHADDCSRQSYVTPAGQGFDGTLREDVANAYAGLQHSFGNGLSFNLSAKGEYYHNNGRHEWNFIPLLGATYFKTAWSIFQLNFTTQRVYPSYWDLHSGTNYLNDYSLVLGNPALQPYLNYSAQLSYIMKQKYAATFYFQYGDKASVQLPYQSPDELRLVYQTINMNYKRIVGLNLHAPFNVGYVWDATATVNVFNQRERADRFHDISFDNSKWIFYGGLNNTIRFTRTCPVTLSVDAAYISSAIQGSGTFNSLWRVDAGLKWQLGRKRCCELTIKADDIFNTWSPTMRIVRSGQDFRMKVRDMTRNVKVTFVWRFNGFKPADTTVDTSRFGTGK